MPTPGLNNSSGVGGPGGGYTADTSAMASQARTIHDAAENAQGEVEELGTSEVNEAMFGTAHTQWAADYTAGIQQLGTGATAMCTTLIGFAASIGSAGKQYDAAESDQASAATQSGSGL